MLQQRLIVIATEKANFSNGPIEQPFNLTVNALSFPEHVAQIFTRQVRRCRQCSRITDRCLVAPGWNSGDLRLARHTGYYAHGTCACGGFELPSFSRRIKKEIRG